MQDFFTLCTHVYSKNEPSLYNASLQKHTNLVPYPLLGCMGYRGKGHLNSFLKAFNVDPDCWKEAAQDQASWRNSIHKGAKLCEENRTAAAEQ